MNRLIKSFVPLSAAALLLSACGPEKARVDDGSLKNQSGVKCDVPVSTSTRLTKPLQHCLIDEVIGDFLANFDFDGDQMYLFVDANRVENRTDQTTVDATDLVTYVQRKLRRESDIQTLRRFSSGDITATHILSLKITGQRVYESGGAASVQYELTFSIEDPFTSLVIDDYIADVRVARGRRSIF